MNKINIDPNVPVSKPLPKSELYIDEEKKEEIKKTRGMSPANNINLSLGITNLPSPSLETSQKNRDKVTPIDSKNPFPASRVIGIQGKKKNGVINIVNNKDANDNLLKNSTFFDSIFYILS